MSSRDDGGPAFPTRWRNEGDRNATAPDGQIVPPGYEVDMPGMSLRDYLAAAALTGWLAGSPADAKADEKRLALRCYAFADVMLEARSQ